MPLQIIHQDITKVTCDAIVNPTDPIFSGSGGTDYAIHRAAGPELAIACRQLERLSQGVIAVTDAYELPCRYIFHTMGPIWTGGRRNEAVLLRSCYTNALFKAAELGLSSIAFPLISSGTFGFPKDQVLRIALTAIGDFLKHLDTDLDVCVCVFDPEAYELSLQPELERFLQIQKGPGLSADMCESSPICASPRRTLRDALHEFAANMSLAESCACEEDMVDAECTAPCAPAALMPAMAPTEDLESWLKKQDECFAVTLLRLIDKKHMTDVQCYKKANVTRKTFWKINNDRSYRPSKPTVLAFAIALELNLEETEALLKTVGFSLSHSSTSDMIVEFYIRKKIYDIYEINAALYKYDQVCLGC